ncbi:MAG: hypothetical protein H7A47_03785 [Verrucomicrobiales bacterium]|nr:hypothetical protein [Verrucomicrobiales bacterium]
MTEPATTWVCFAVREEAAPFRRLVRGGSGVRVLLTGMGAANARGRVAAALQRAPPPAQVISSGFAGGLNPGLRSGALLHAGFSAPETEARLQRLGSQAARFLMSDRIVNSVAEKQALWHQEGADAVEMESGAIQEACRAAGVPCAVLRVVSDPADVPLPLDFNQLLTPDCRIDGRKLAVSLLRSPGKIPELLRFQRQVRFAAERLASALAMLLLAHGSKPPV